MNRKLLFVTFNFSLTLLLSAFLLFWIQPLIAKLILPKLGGVPAVWNTSMMFFQGILLVGYIYAYFFSRNLKLTLQIFLQIGFMFLAALVLPITVDQLGNPPSFNNPIAWLILLLILAVGPVALMLSTLSPLLQYWYGQGAQEGKRDPYFLYVSSNVGSLLGLLSFPFLLEPLLTLKQQSLVWSVGYIGLVLLLAICGVSLLQKKEIRDIVIYKKESPLETPNWRLRLRWMLLAFVPSGLLLSTTTYLTTDIAAAPLFWVIPFALYIITFIIAFSKINITILNSLLKAEPFFIIWLLLLPIFLNLLPSHSFLLATIVVYLFVFFICALYCHCQLYFSRPSIYFLTEFYLWIAFGGFLGGIVNALLAPIIFTRLYEYVFFLSFAYMLRPSDWSKRDYKLLFFPVLIIVIFFLYFLFMGNIFLSQTLQFLAIMICILTYYKPVIFGLCLILVLYFGIASQFFDQKVLFENRNFYGTIKITEDPIQKTRFLLSGVTLHGLESIDKEKKIQITSYYTPLAPVFIHYYFLKPKLQIAGIGLGTGTIACFKRPGDTITFYELNPIMKIVATNPNYFSFLTQCAPDARIILGDARLQIALAKPYEFDLIIVDAFTSDAIPLHLLTIEAVGLYLDKLSQDGALLFNISNRYFNLAPVLANIANRLGLVAMIKNDIQPSSQTITLSSLWVLITRPQNNLDELKKYGWTILNMDVTSKKIWTDDYSNLLGIIH